MTLNLVGQNVMRLGQHIPAGIPQKIIVGSLVTTAAEGIGKGLGVAKTFEDATKKIVKGTYNVGARLRDGIQMKKQSNAEKEATISDMQKHVSDIQMPEKTVQTVPKENIKKDDDKDKEKPSAEAKGNAKNINEKPSTEVNGQSQIINETVT